MSCQIQVIKKQGVVLIQLVGDSFCIQTVQEMRAALQPLIDTPPESPIAICTDGLALLGSSCLSGIIETAFQLRKRGVTIFIAEARPCVLDVFEIASLHAILPIHDTVEDGLDALRAASD
ncbi:MAG: hypothetical protein RL318_1043 [Fibrobacterota bacterium]|jgi:anti-anti-sigma factor